MSIEGPNNNIEDQGVKDVYAHWENNQFPPINEATSISGEQARAMGATDIDPDAVLEKVNE
jgi:hypothetical protein